MTNIISRTLSFFFLNIYLFWLRRVLVAERGIFVAAGGIFSWGMWTS